MQYDLQSSLIVGQGKTSIQTARYLQKQGKPFAIYSLAPNQLPKDLKPYYTQSPSNYTLVWLSPGIPPTDKIYQLLDPAIPWIVDIDYFLSQSSSQVILVTGTNGKSTLVKYLDQLIRSAGLTSMVGGNYQPGVLSFLDLKPNWVVLELSSFMLHWMQKTHRVAGVVLLDIEPDHLDWHGSFLAYQKAKQKIKYYSDICIDTNTVLKKRTLHLSDVAYQLLDRLAIPYRVQSPPALPFRQTKSSYSERTYINDSKATNLAAVIFCLRNIRHQYAKQPILLILAGVPKEQQHDKLRSVLDEKVSVVVVGKGFSDLSDVISQRYPSIGALKPCIIKFKGIVVFSPGGASYDSYDGFEQRGYAFDSLIKTIEDKA